MKSRPHPEFGAPALVFGQGLGFEAGQRRTLGHAAGADVEVLRQLFDRRHQFARGSTIQPRRQPVMPKYLLKLLMLMTSSPRARALWPY
jgi:hypothetical protein